MIPESQILPNLRLRLGLRERITFRLHLAYAACDGLSLGILALNEFILLKSLHCTDMQVAILFQIATVPMLLSTVLTGYISRVRNIRAALRRMAWITRAPLFLFLLFPAAPVANGWAWAHLALFAFYYMASPFILPSINVFTRANYSALRFGRLFSLAQSTTQLFTFGATIVTGVLLRWDNGAFRYLLPALGVAGLIGIYAITAAPVRFGPREIRNPGNGPSRWAAAGATLRQAYEILKGDRNFTFFQAGMMSYGIGFHMALGVVAIFLQDYLKLKYDAIAIIKNIPVLLSIVTYPLIGSFMDKRDPHTVAAVTYVFCICYFLLLLLTYWMPNAWMVRGWSIPLVSAFVFYGIFAAGIGLVWTIGSSYFAPLGMAGTYHGIHISLTGIRGLIAPPLGILIYQKGGFAAAFTICLLLQVIAIIIQRYSRHPPRIKLP